MAIKIIQRIEQLLGQDDNLLKYRPLRYLENHSRYFNGFRIFSARKTTE